MNAECDHWNSFLPDALKVMRVQIHIILLWYLTRSILRQVIPFCCNLASHILNTRLKILEASQSLKVMICRINWEIFPTSCSGLRLGGFCGNRIWKAHVQTKVAFFTWTDALGKILILDNFHCCRITMVDWHYMRKNSEQGLTICCYIVNLLRVVFSCFIPVWGDGSAK